MPFLEEAPVARNPMSYSNFFFLIVVFLFVDKIALATKMKKDILRLTCWRYRRAKKVCPTSHEAKPLKINFTQIIVYLFM